MPSTIATLVSRVEQVARPVWQLDGSIGNHNGGAPLRAHSGVPVLTFGVVDDRRVRRIPNQLAEPTTKLVDVRGLVHRQSESSGREDEYHYRDVNVAQARGTVGPIRKASLYA